MADIRDVFISYVQADHIRVEMPAQNLHQLRPEMCFDERNTSPRSIFIHRRDDDNRTAKDSIAISPATLNTRFWIKQCTSAF